MTPWQEMAVLIASGVGMGVVLRMVLEAYSGVFWLFWDIVTSIRA